MTVVQPYAPRRVSQTLPSNHRLVHVTPAPILAGLEGLDDWVTAMMEMTSRVPMRRGIAAADVTAGEAQAQMHPARADSQAILAAFGTRRYIANHFQMRVNHLVPIPSGPANPECLKFRCGANKEGATW